MTRPAAVLTRLALAAAVAWPALAAAAPEYDDPAGLPSGGERGYIRTPPSAFVATPHGGLVSGIIYLNRCTGGCTFTKSSINDATSNQTIIGNVDPGTTMMITEFAHSEAVWTELVDCVRAVYSPYDVEIVTEDPGLVPHHEAVVAGRAADINRPGVLGVAPLDSNTCEPKNNVISFSLANDHGSGAGLTLAQHICWTVAQESAHSFGLDHAFDCTDPLTYMATTQSGGPCGVKFFRNKLLDCGEFESRDCICGGTKQNAHSKLLAVHGPGQTPPPPTINVSGPMDGATVQRGFGVYATAIDPRGVDRIELRINGWKWAEVPGVPLKTSAYVLSVPLEVPDGVMELDISSCNDLNSCATQRVTVTQGAPCTTADTCLLGQRCDAGRCLWDPPAGEIGDACTFPQACISNVCADIGGGDLACTETCYGGPNDLCPDGFRCTGGTGQQGVCAPPSDEGGCCSAGDLGASRLAVNLGLGALVGLLVVRRRRRRA
ncbi:MAG: hypothetical protein HS111_38505 [Kofleriaceae bacterium]|nr:hypothetical protein [Kofleriaceae bacterium]MCL4223419.1 hypothetical protein [Myxococcales bacterium]